MYWEKFNIQCKERRHCINRRNAFNHTTSFLVPVLIGSYVTQIHCAKYNGLPFIDGTRLINVDRWQADSAMTEWCLNCCCKHAHSVPSHILYDTVFWLKRLYSDARPFRHLISPSGTFTFEFQQRRLSTCGMALQQVRLLSSWLHNGQAAIGHADKGTRGEKKA